MAGAAVQVEGLDNLVRTLRKAGADLNELKDASKEAGDTITGAATGRAPRRTGRLAGSMRASRLAKGVRVPHREGDGAIRRRHPLGVAGAEHHSPAVPHRRRQGDRADLDRRSTWRTSRRSSTR